MLDREPAWREPSAREGTARIAGLELPAPQIGCVVDDELVLHAWDLAVPTGQPYAPSPGDLEAPRRMVSGAPDDPQARGGLLGPVVAVPAGAPLLDRSRRSRPGPAVGPRRVVLRPGASRARG